MDDGVTTRDVVLSMSAKLTSVAEDVATIRQQTVPLADAASDHEKRLRSLEKFRYALPSAAFISALLAMTLALPHLFT